MSTQLLNASLLAKQMCDMHLECCVTSDTTLEGTRQPTAKEYIFLKGDSCEAGGRPYNDVDWQWRHRAVQSCLALPGQPQAHGLPHALPGLPSDGMINVCQHCMPVVVNTPSNFNWMHAGCICTH